MTDDHLTEMIRAQRALQDRLGNDFTQMDARQRIQFIKDMTLSATAELFEALNETSWKPWTTGEPRINLVLVGNELSDAWQFICNVWLACWPHATSEQLAALMRETLDTKLLVNHRRVTDGYDGTNKCPECRRALDDPAVECEVTVNGYRCEKTGVTHLNSARS